MDGKGLVLSAALTAQGARSLGARSTMQQGGDPGDHLFQARFPAHTYEWLRAQWFARRVAMTAVVIAAIAAARDARISLDEALARGAGDEETQRFTVRLSERDYEWLRLEAFQRRIPINRLLSASIDAYRQWTEAGNPDPAHDQRST